MAAFPLPPSLSYQNPSGHVAVNNLYLPVSSTGDPSVPVPQIPYPLSPHGTNDQDSLAMLDPPPYHTVAYGGYQGPPLTVSPPPYPQPYQNNDSELVKNASPLQPPPSVGFYGSADAKPSGICPMPQLPYLPILNENSNLEANRNHLEPEHLSDSGSFIDEYDERASAPPLSSIEAVPGYEHIAFDYAILSPPPASEWPEGPPDRHDVPCLHRFSKEEVESAVQHFAFEHCCYGHDVAKKMDITEITMSSVYHYTLDTFGEKRESAWCTVPYEGQPIDGPANGRAPGPWEVVVQPQGYFKDSKTKLEVPHTAVVKSCHGCNSRGRVRCSQCFGRGRRSCTSCHGRGRTNNGRCSFCGGSGRKRCMRCHGTGKVKCRKCNGHGKLKMYLELSVTWKNHFDDYVSDSSVVPNRKIRKVSGQVVFEEKKPKVLPLNHCADHHVNQASANLVARQNREFPDE